LQIEGPVLVTGGAGFLGKHIVEALVAQGLKVVVFDLANNYQPPAGVVFVRGNLCKKDEIIKALKEHSIKVVFHVASPDPNSPNKQLLRDVNVTGTQNTIDSCLEVGVKTLIYTSSASVVWQGQGQEGVDESCPYPTSFRDTYAETKAEAERLIMAAGEKGKTNGNLIAIGLRPHAIFGPRDPTLLPTWIGLAKNGKQKFIVGDGNNIVDWTYVGNVVHSHLLAAEVAQKHLSDPSKCAANGKSYFITNNQPMPFWVFMNNLLLGLGYEPSKARIPYKFVLGIAYVATAIVGYLNKSRPKEKQIPMTLSPSRLQISGTAHWYNIEGAKKDLGYMPVWDMDSALYLTLKAFNHVRCGKPGPLALANAREGNLVKLKLVDDPEAKAAFRDSATIHKVDKTM
jgi:sterol-4alpha-carboxylate 3-dehydrogenase (decarboxylating)